MKKGKKRFFINTLLFLSPVLILLLLELFIFPIEQFTLRAWETLKVKNDYIAALIGPFYPDRYLEIEEIGELASYTPYAVKRKAVWYTDQYGFRNRNAEQKPEIVIIGDSQITGVKLTQDEILSEVLERKLNKPVYALAPSTLEKYLHTERFAHSPPRIVIISRTERNIAAMDSIRTDDTNRKLLSKLDFITQVKAITEGLIVADRIQKFTMYRKADKLIDLSFNNPDHHFYEGEFFVQGQQANKQVSRQEVDRIIGVIESYKTVLQERGTKFIFLPVPNKENIYYQLLPQGKKPTFLTTLTQGLEAKNIEVINTQAAFDKAYQQKQLKLYPTDDGHWNAAAVEIASDLLVQMIDSIQIREQKHTKMQQ